MMTKPFEHQFVVLMPKTLEQGILYISFEHNTIVHLCACGCGCKVATSISPESWKITYDGKTISITPSFGNWNLECKSHYIIRKNVAFFIPDKFNDDWKLKKVKKRKRQ